ncbi:MAG: fumarate hydratase [Thermoplasmata archaeon]
MAEGFNIKIIEQTAVELLRMAVTSLPEDVVAALRRMHDEETEPAPKMQLAAILENLKLAEESGTPLCQDTGIHVFFVRGPFHPNFPVRLGDIEEAIRRGVERATKEIPLRPNAVHPLTRKNSGTNLGAHLPCVLFEPSDENFIELTAMPKGAGSENMSAMAMLTPSAGERGVKKFVFDTLLRAGSNPCPPVVLGVGIGGSADLSLALAKRALFRPLGSRNPDPEAARLEEELFDALNGIGIGPMGLGGRSTLLGLHIELAHCHTASLPVAVNIQCWAARRATARIHPDARVEWLTHKKSRGVG